MKRINPKLNEEVFNSVLSQLKNHYEAIERLKETELDKNILSGKVAYHCAKLQQVASEWPTFWDSEEAERFNKFLAEAEKTSNLILNGVSCPYCGFGKLTGNGLSYYCFVCNRDVFFTKHFPEGNLMLRCKITDYGDHIVVS